MSEKIPHLGLMIAEFHYICEWIYSLISRKDLALRGLVR